MKLIAGEEGLIYDPNALDINRDGTVNTKDFVMLMQYIAKIPVVIY